MPSSINAARAAFPLTSFSLVYRLMASRLWGSVMPLSFAASRIVAVSDGVNLQVYSSLIGCVMSRSGARALRYASS